MSQSEYPELFGVHRFKVEIDGLHVAGFSEVDGLKSQVETTHYKEGGVNSYVHYFPTRVEYEPLILKRGLSNASFVDRLWDWYVDYTRGKIVKKNGAIILQDRSGSEICRWNFFQAQPVAWEGPSFHSTSSDIAIESFQLIHEGLKLEVATDYNTSLLFG